MKKKAIKKDDEIVWTGEMVSLLKKITGIRYDFTGTRSETKVNFRFIHFVW